MHADHTFEHNTSCFEYYWRGCAQVNLALSALISRRLPGFGCTHSSARLVQSDSKKKPTSNYVLKFKGMRASTIALVLVPFANGLWNHTLFRQVLQQQQTNAYIRNLWSRIALYNLWCSWWSSLNGLRHYWHHISKESAWPRWARFSARLLQSQKRLNCSFAQVWVVCRTSLNPCLMIHVYL